jgi:hypothetical protein
MLFNFLVHEDTFWSMFLSKKFQKKVGQKFIRVRIRTFSKVGSGSGQKSSGSATLVGGINDKADIVLAVSQAAVLLPLVFLILPSFLKVLSSIQAKTRPNSEKFNGKKNLVKHFL